MKFKGGVRLSDEIQRGVEAIGKSDLFNPPSTFIFWNGPFKTTANIFLL